MTNKEKEAFAGGIIEFNIITGVITWANEFALNKIGHNLKQLQQLTIFDVIPEHLRDRVCDKQSTIISGQESNFSVWPSIAPDNQIHWWYVLETKTSHPLRQVRCEFVQTTKNGGTTYIFMCIQMDMTNRYNTLNYKFTGLDNRVRRRIDKLSEKQQTLETFIREDLLKHFDEIGKRADDHTAEILKLINLNVVNKKRINSFEQHVQTVADLAIKSIVMQANKTGKRVYWIIIVVLITTLITLTQYMIWHN